MNENTSINPVGVERVHGYAVKRSIVFENDRGFALAENPNAPQPYVTWQFTEENGKRDYYWGHYTANADMAAKDYEARIEDYTRQYGFMEKEFVTDAELSGRYEKIMDSKAQNEKRPISEQLKEGAEQAAKENATRPTPAKNTEKDR